MSNLNELRPVGSLNPFGRLCCTIGHLPTSYMASLTYEEQVMWFCDYLKNTVIPAVNQNAEAVFELQNLYIELKNYVDNYFDNLDVQEEINNKLDEMALNGTLELLLKNTVYKDTSIVFDTLLTALDSEKLEENYTFRTLGYRTKNDKGNGLYTCLAQQFYKTNDEEPNNSKQYYILENDVYTPIETPLVFDESTIYYEGLYVDNGITIRKVNDYLYAFLIPENNIITPEQAGAYGDGVHDDTSYIQNLLDYAGHNYSIHLFNKYLISSTLYISNADAGRNREPKYFFGENNSGFIKNNSGFLFSANSRNNGDLFFDNVYFESTQGEGTKIFDCDKIIRTKLTNCYFRNVDCILYAYDYYVQSFKVLNCTINGGSDSAFEVSGCYDLAIENCLIENRENFFEHTMHGTYNYLSSLFIYKNCIENLSGFVGKFGNSKVLEFIDNYTEYNEYDIEFLTNCILYNVRFENNSRYGEKQSSDAFITWKGTVYSVFSKNNYIGEIPCHDVTGITTGRIISENDMISPNSTPANLGEASKIINFKTNEVIYDTNETVTPLGKFKRISKARTDIVLSANQENVYGFQFDSNLSLDDFITVQLLPSNVNKKVACLNTVRFNNYVYVFIKNYENEEVSLTSARVNVLKPYLSTTG